MGSAPFVLEVDLGGRFGAARSPEQGHRMGAQGQDLDEVCSPVSARKPNLRVLDRLEALQIGGNSGRSLRLEVSSLLARLTEVGFYRFD